PTWFGRLIRTTALRMEHEPDPTLGPALARRESQFQWSSSGQSGGPGRAGVDGRGVADGGAEVVGEVGLVEVAEVAGEQGQVEVVPLVEALDRLVEAGPADDPLGGDAGVGGEQPLEAAGADPEATGQLPDQGDLAVGHDLVHHPVDQGEVRGR